MTTDTQLQAKVMAELIWEPSINVAHIGIEVHDGIVTLSGHVDSDAQRHGVTCAVHRVRGVRATADEMDVTLPGPEREEPVATHRAEGLLQRMTALLCNAVPVKLAFA